VDFGGRKEIFRALVGSHNYNLNTETSDKDYKIFIAPTFDDLYFNNQFSKSYIGQTEDFDCHDIRKTSSLWWKSNVNFLEVLFTQESYINENLKADTKNNLNEILKNKKEIAKMNLPYLYDACIGMHITKKKQIDKGTEGTQYLVDKYGYDTKQALHSWRILDFLRRFADTGFNNFKKAIWYEEEDNKRNFLLHLKDGKFTRTEYFEIVEHTLLNVETEFKEIYKSQKPNKKTNQFLLKMVKEIVKNELF